VNACTEALDEGRLVSLILNVEEHINEQHRQLRQLLKQRKRKVCHRQKLVVACDQTCRLSSFPHNARSHLKQNTDFSKQHVYFGLLFKWPIITIIIGQARCPKDLARKTIGDCQIWANTCLFPNQQC